LFAAKWLMSMMVWRKVALGVLVVALLGFAPLAGADQDAPATQADPTQISNSTSPLGGLPDGALITQAVGDAINTTTALPPQPTLLAIPGDDRPSCNTDYLETTSPGCVDGDPNGTRTIVVWGDSHAWMWLPALDAIGRDTHAQIVQFDKSSCPPQDMRIWLDRLRRAYTECDEFRRFVEARIQALHPDVVVLTGAEKGVRIVAGGHGTPQGVEDAWATGVASTIGAVAPFTARTIVLSDSPYPLREPTDCLSGHANDVHVCDTPRSGAIDEFGLPVGAFDDHNLREQQVVEQNGARYVSVTPWFCTDSACPAVVGGLAVYRDAFHISPNYAFWLSGALATALGVIR
jgi:hypothetical protein